MDKLRARSKQMSNPGKQGLFQETMDGTGNTAEKRIEELESEVNVLQKELAECKRSENTLQESERLLRLAFNSALVAVWDRDMQENHTVWSDTAEMVLGFQPGSFGNNHEAYMKWVHPDDIGPINKRVSQALEKHQTEYRSEYRMIRPDGEIRWISSPGQIFYDSKGVPVRMAGIMMDITERRQAEEELKTRSVITERREAEEELKQAEDELEARVKERTAELTSTIQLLNDEIRERKTTEENLRKFKFISDNSNDAHFLIDRDAKFLYVNKSACRMMGYSEEELLTLGIPDVDIIIDLDNYQMLFNLAQTETLPLIESINRRKDGSQFPSEITITGHRIEGRPYMFANLRDITQRRIAEDKKDQS